MTKALRKRPDQTTEGKFWRRSKPACSGRRAPQGSGSPESGARNSRRLDRTSLVPAEWRTLLKGKGSSPWAPEWARRAPPPAWSGEGNKGAKPESRQQPGRPHPAPGSRSSPAAGRSGSRPQARPGPPDGRKRSRLPFPQTLTLAGPPKPLRSSSKQAAGRARPGRGPRVPRKPQAAQVEPGRRHRKSRVSSLPFLRGDLVTGKGEVSLSGSSQSRFRLRHAAPQALQFRGRPAQCCRRPWRGEAASIAIREGEGRRVERVSGGEAAEGRRARRRRSESTQPVATPRAATWGAAEAPRGAPGGRTLSPRGLGLVYYGSPMVLPGTLLASLSI
ncbi:uncharacterized protein LOC106144782 [Ictidomys tridecemlineatus]